uniref:Uncharacterized protein n=1 Tax=Plectus sambesii TaxID=2011161 RepID=A0A914VL50_9BILA
MNCKRWYICLFFFALAFITSSSALSSDSLKMEQSIADAGEELPFDQTALKRWLLRKSRADRPNGYRPNVNMMPRFGRSDSSFAR